MSPDKTKLSDLLSEESSDGWLDQFDAIVQKAFPEYDTKVFIKQHYAVFLISLCLHLCILFVISLVPSKQLEVEQSVRILNEYVPIEKENLPQAIDLDQLVQVTDLYVLEETVAPDNDLESEPLEELPEEEVEIEGQKLDSIHDHLALNVESLPMILHLPTKEAGRVPMAYHNRMGSNKKRAIQKFGGDDKTMASVEAALAWLAFHQEADGSWNVEKYDGNLNNESFAFSATACALLPFFGAGHSENTGQYKNTVKKGIRYLNSVISKKSVKKEAGKYNFGKNYGTAIGLMALSEAILFGSSSMTQKHANHLAQELINQQLRLRKGWGYEGAGEDLSVSGWVALGLKSAKDAKLKALKTTAARLVFNSYKRWVDEVMTDKKTGLACYQPDNHGNAPNMTWVGMFQKQFLGFPKTDPFLKKAASNTLSKRWIDHVFETKNIRDVYGIYYGTLAAFQQQGAFWDKWNANMKKYLIKSQKSGSNRETGGSWDPGERHVGKVGGRVMTTALLTLCLEVYYRYELMN